LGHGGHWDMVDIGTWWTLGHGGRGTCTCTCTCTCMACMVHAWSRVCLREDGG